MIAWKQRKYRKYFENEANYVEFSKLMVRLLRAHTRPLARALQSEMVHWLKARKEKRAAKWYGGTWTGEHGNVTNADAGHAMTNDGQGIESHWRYMRRGVAGQGGTNCTLSMPTFVPSVLTYMGDLSVRHASKIFNAEMNEYIFRNIPVLTPEMYTALQETDVRVLQLSYMEGDAASRKKFGRKIIKMDAIAAEASALTPLMEKIRMWQVSGNKIDIARTKCTSIIMPTSRIVRMLERKGHSTLLSIEAALFPLREEYMLLTSKSMDEYFEQYPCRGVDHMLDIMECFYRLAPLQRKNGWQAWLCCCDRGFRDECCSHSALLTALWEELRVPAAQSTLEMKNREGRGRKAATPWSFYAERKNKGDKEMEEVVRAIPNWHPAIVGPPAEEDEDEGGEEEAEEEAEAAEEGSSAALRKHKYGSEQAVPPTARRRLVVSSEETVKEVVQEQVARSKKKPPIPKAKLCTCVSSLSIA